MTIGGVEGDDDACRRACRGPAAARCDDGQRLQTNLKTFLSWFSFGSNSLEKPWGSPKDPSGRGNSGFEPSGISQVRVVRGPGDALFSRTLNRLSTAETFLVQNVEIGSSIVSVTSTENKTQAAQGTEQCAGRDTAAALDACLIAEKRGDAAAAACCCCSPLLLLLHSFVLLAAAAAAAGNGGGGGAVAGKDGGARLLCILFDGKETTATQGACEAALHRARSLRVCNHG